MVRPVVEAAGLEALGRGLRGQEGRPVLRVTVDRAGGDLDAVAEVSERLSRRLDLEDFSDRTSPAGGQFARRGAGAARTAPLRAEHRADAEGEDGGACRRAAGARGRVGLGRRGGDRDASDGGELRVPYADVASAKTSSSGAQRRGADDESGHDRGAEGARAREGHRVETIAPCRARGGHGVGIQVVVEAAAPPSWRRSRSACVRASTPSRATSEFGSNSSGDRHEDEETGEITTDSKVLSEEEVEVTDEFKGRIGAQTAKQVIFQKLRDAEREMTYEEFAGREGDIVTGIVQQSERRYAARPGRSGGSAAAGRTGTVGAVPERRASPGVHHRGPPRHQGPQIVVSRTHPGLLKKLFELEVPEIEEGIVEIKAVAREPGHRSKIAVASREPAVDPVGASVGPKGSRVRNVVTELREKIDVVPWAADPPRWWRTPSSPPRSRRRASTTRRRRRS